jgi:peptidoglycan hydrolase-like amidase
MSARCPGELLKAHAVVARSWLLAQLNAKSMPSQTGPQTSVSSEGEITRWYDRESHDEFDVCADDHCQRYQGITKAFSEEVFNAIRATRGQVLVFLDGTQEKICDARYSKCCGGVTEVYSTAWQNKDAPYLVSIYDGPGRLEGYPMPLSDHCNAAEFINQAPPAFCNTTSADLLSRLLPSFDQETHDFYRWRVRYAGDELSDIVEARLGAGLGRIHKLEPLERGQSGRIKRLRIAGEKRSLIIGKELEIRRALSRSHLYSSAFIVRTIKDPVAGQPKAFDISGAGWGHGVGLCQIGAAVMAEQGYECSEILAHYFPNTSLTSICK